MMRPLAFLLTIATLILASPAPAFAEPYLGWDLERREIRLNHWYEDGLRKSLAAQASESDTLDARARNTVLYALDDLERVCRTNLLSKMSEPGSPWLEWRSLGRVEQDTTAHWLGAVSCIDILCGNPAPHDRLAILTVGPMHAIVTLLPARDPTIHDRITTLDSLSVIEADTHAIVIAHIGSSSDHPCWDGPEYSSGTLTKFALLSAAGVDQCFELYSSSEDMSHDDVDGDTGGSLETVIEARPEEIIVDYQAMEWSESWEEGTYQEKTEVTDEGRWIFRFENGRFVQVE